MTFFGRQTSIGKFKIDTEGVSAESPEVQKRLNRIATNYEKLNEVLTELEFKMDRDAGENPELKTVDPKKPR